MEASVRLVVSGLVGLCGLLLVLHFGTRTGMPARQVVALMAMVAVPSAVAGLVFAPLFGQQGVRGALAAAQGAIAAPILAVSLFVTYHLGTVGAHFADVAGGTDAVLQAAFSLPTFLAWVVLGAHLHLAALWLRAQAAGERVAKGRRLRPPQAWILALLVGASGILTALAFQGGMYSDPPFLIVIALAASFAGGAVAGGFGHPGWHGALRAILAALVATALASALVAIYWAWPNPERIAFAPSYGPLVFVLSVLNVPMAGALWVASLAGVHLVARHLRRISRGSSGCP